MELHWKYSHRIGAVDKEIEQEKAVIVIINQL
jgi:hypothetical protein